MKRSLTVRLDHDLLNKMEESRQSPPYPTTATAIIERGINLAIDEIKRMTANGGNYG